VYPEIEPSKWITLWCTPPPVSTITTASTTRLGRHRGTRRRAAADRGEHRDDGDRDACDRGAEFHPVKCGLTATASAATTTGVTGVVGSSESPA